MVSWRILVMGAVVSAIVHPSFSPIQPRAFFAPTAPLLEGALQANTKLREAQLLFQGQVLGPEDVIGDDEGNLWCSNRDGSIRKLWRNGSVTVWAHVGGHPLGIEWVQKGSQMVVCDADKVGSPVALVPCVGTCHCRNFEFPGRKKNRESMDADR